MAAREHSITRCGILRVKIYSVTSADVRMLPRCNLLAWSRCSRRTKADSQTIYSLFIITPQYWHFCFSKLGVSIIKINAALIQLSLVFYMHIFMTLEQSLSFYNSHLQWKIRRRRRRKRRKKKRHCFQECWLNSWGFDGISPTLKHWSNVDFGIRSGGQLGCLRHTCLRLSTTVGIREILLLSLSNIEVDAELVLIFYRDLLEAWSRFVISTSFFLFLFPFLSLSLSPFQFEWSGVIL